jgi:4-hydroxyphenylpyruvate dioxygenase-like putative hemolysin
MLGNRTAHSPAKGESMQISNIDHLNLTVADFDTSVDWYQRVLGFELVEEDVQDGTRWGVIRQGDAMLCIYQFEDCRLEDRFAMRKMGLHGINHFGLRITDQDAWEKVIARENIKVLYDGPIRWPHSKFGILRTQPGTKSKFPCGMMISWLLVKIKAHNDMLLNI